METAPTVLPLVPSYRAQSKSLRHQKPQTWCGPLHSCFPLSWSLLPLMLSCCIPARNVPWKIVVKTMSSLVYKVSMIHPFLFFSPTLVSPLHTHSSVILNDFLFPNKFSVSMPITLAPNITQPKTHVFPSAHLSKPRSSITAMGETSPTPSPSSLTPWKNWSLPPLTQHYTLENSTTAPFYFIKLAKLKSKVISSAPTSISFAQ